MIRPGFLCWAVNTMYALNWRVPSCDEDPGSSWLITYYFNAFPYDEFGPA